LYPKAYIDAVGASLGAILPTDNRLLAPGLPSPTAPFGPTLSYCEYAILDETGK
jgi:hypothetical protein